MPLQTSNDRRVAPAPLPDYARAAVAAVRDDQRQGVLAWRIANHLVLQLRHLTGRPSAELSQVPETEANFYLHLAAAAIALTETIDYTARPTAFEIARYEGRRAIALARARGRLDARHLGHDIDVFRPSEPGYELARCRTCGAGVTLHLETAGLSASRPLTQPCASTR